MDLIELDVTVNRQMSVCHCRLVHSGKQPTLSGAGDILTFGTRSGTRHGVEAHVFRVQTSRDLATWTHALVQGVSNAVLFVREVSTGNYYQDCCVDACLHFTARCKTDCTRSSAIAEGPRDASCQLKSCQLPRNSAETTYVTSPDQINGIKLEI